MLAIGTQDRVDCVTCLDGPVLGVGHADMLDIKQSLACLTSKRVQVVLEVQGSMRSTRSFEFKNISGVSEYFHQLQVFLQEHQLMLLIKAAVGR